MQGTHRVAQGTARVYRLVLLRVNIPDQSQGKCPFLYCLCRLHRLGNLVVELKFVLATFLFAKFAVANLR